MALICEITDGYDLECSSVGGVTHIWLGTWDPLMSWTLGTASGVTPLNMVNGGAHSGIAPNNQVHLFKINQRPEYAEFTQDGQFNFENGTTAYETKLSMRFIHLDNELRNLLNEIGRAPILAVVKSQAGDYYLAGVELAGYASEGKSGVGKSITDLNGADLTITWKSMNGAFLIDENAFDDTTIGALDIQDNLPELILPNV